MIVSFCSSIIYCLSLWYHLWKNKCTPKRITARTVSTSLDSFLCSQLEETCWSWGYFSSHRGSVSYNWVSRPHEFFENAGQRNRFLHLNLEIWRLYRKPCMRIICLTIPVWLPGYSLIQVPSWWRAFSFLSIVPSAEQEPESIVNLCNWNNTLK